MAKTNDIQTKHSEVARHWLFKCIDKTGKLHTNLMEAMQAGKMLGTDLIEVTDDYYEPCCWACGKKIVKETGKLERLYAKYSLDDTEGEELEHCIDGFLNDKNTTKGLYRCHIKSPVLGGEDKPDNLFLLCGDCKTESPNTSNPETFYRWVYNRRKDYMQGFPYKAFNDALEKELEQRELNLELSDVLKEIDVNMEEYKEFVHNNVAYDRVRVGSNIPIITTVGVTVDYILSKIEK